MGAHDLGKKNDGAFGSSVEPLMPLDYAIGVGTFVPNNAVIMHDDVVKLISGVMKERGIKHTTSECTLRGFTCSGANVDPKTATPAEIAKIRKIQIGYQVDGLTGGLAVEERVRNKRVSKSLSTFQICDSERTGFCYGPSCRLWRSFPAFALDPQKSVSQFSVSIWTQQRGPPSTPLGPGPNQRWISLGRHRRGAREIRRLRVHSLQPGTQPTPLQQHRRSSLGVPEIHCGLEPPASYGVLGRCACGPRLPARIRLTKT